MIEPLSAPVVAGKGSALYRAHSYHTKVPPEGIVPHIVRCCPPGGTVLDPFCGSGMTGVAARLAGRNAVLVDISPLATFISRHHCHPPQPEQLPSEMDLPLREAEAKLGRIYETHCRRCARPATLLRTIWSQKLRCLRCSHEFRLADTTADGRVRREFACPHCRRELRKGSCERLGYDPIELHYRCTDCGKALARIAPGDMDWQLATGDYSTEVAPEWRRQLDVPIPERADEIARLHRDGVKRLSELFTPRNLAVLLYLRAKVTGPNSTLLFLLSSALPRASRLNRYLPHLRAVPGHTFGTMYLPGLQAEENVFLLLRRKRENLRRYSELFYSKAAPTSTVQVHTRSATDLSNIPDQTIDYVFTDPPFGANIAYSELNFLWEAFLGEFTDARLEAVVSKAQKKDATSYRRLMAESLTEANRVLRRDGWLTMVFHNTSSQVWLAVHEALCAARFEVVSTSTFSKGKNLSFKQFTASGTVTHDVVLHCRKCSQPVRPSVLSCGELRKLIGEIEAKDPRQHYSLALGAALARGKTLGVDYAAYCELLAGKEPSDAT